MRTDPFEECRIEVTFPAACPRCGRLVALLSLALVGSLPAQTVTPPIAAASPAASAAADDRAAKIAERYRAMLTANPTEGLALDRLWKYHEERGTTAVLLDSYQQAAAKPDADLATLLVDGYLLKKAGRLDEAAALYERANGRDPASPLPWLASAELASARNQPEEAADAYAQALSKLPVTDRRRTDWLLKQGAALLAAGKTTEAAACWEQIVAANPSDLDVRRQLAGVYEQNGFPDRAVTQYAYIEAHADPAARATALRELGRLQEAQGHFDAARDALERGLTLTSRDNWLHGDLQTRLIHLYERAGRVPELAARWRTEVASAPRDLGGYLRLEALAEAEGDAAGESEWLEKIVALTPNDREDTLKLAGRLTEAGERPRAAELYDTLLKRQPNNLELILARADLDVQMGQPAAAVSRVEARVAQSPADDSIVGPALNFFLDHRLPEAAERILRAEVARQSAATEPALALAKFLFSERRAKDARAVLDALAAQPGSAPERAARLSQIAEAYRQGDEPDLALRSWRQAAALQPADPAPLLAAADVLRADGDVPGASALLEQAIRLSPPGTESLAVERKLFETLRGSEEAPRLDPAERASLVGRTEGGDLQPAHDSALGRYLTNLAGTADEHPTAANFLRLARWQSWSHDDPAAVASAQHAIQLDPGSVPARELIVVVAVQSHRNELAEQTLSQLLQLDPAQQGATLHQLANLKLASGDAAEALRLYSSGCRRSRRVRVPPWRTSPWPSSGPTCGSTRSPPGNAPTTCPAAPRHNARKSAARCLPPTSTSANFSRQKRCCCARWTNKPTSPPGKTCSGSWRTLPTSTRWTTVCATISKPGCAPTPTTILPWFRSPGSSSRTATRVPRTSCCGRRIFRRLTRRASFGNWCRPVRIWVKPPTPWRTSSGCSCSRANRRRKTWRS